MKPLFATDVVISAIVNELKSQGVVFSMSRTTKVTWTWFFDGAVRDVQKFVDALRNVMVVETSQTSSFMTARLHVDSEKFTTGQISINSAGVSLFMNRKFK